MVFRYSGFILICIILLSGCFHDNIDNDPVYFIDAHSQVDDELGNLDTILTRMNANNVKKTILATRGNLSKGELLDFAASHTDSIIPSIRTKGNQYETDSQSYYDDIEEDSLNTNYGAIAELLSYHAAKEEKGAPEVAVLPGDARIQTALTIAQSKNWPLVIHIEFASLSATDKDIYWTELKTLLDDNPNTAIVLIHMAQLDSSEVKQLIDAHANVYFITSHTDPITIANSVEPWTALFSNGVLASDWKTLMTDNPSRFIFAMDNVWSNHWGNRYDKVMRYWKEAMADLPQNVAEQIAHGNAERLWNIRAP